MCKLFCAHGDLVHIAAGADKPWLIKVHSVLYDSVCISEKKLHLW